MGSKKFVIIVNMFFMMFSLLEAIDINPVCEISICKKDEGKGYKKFLDNIIDNEASNVLYWFSALGFRPIKLENPPNKGYSIHYYYNDGKKSNLKGNNDFIGLCRNWKSLALQGCYTPDTYGRMAVNVANIYSIDTYLKGKKSTLKGLKTFQETLAHELFHGIERGNEKTLLWLSEATSEAVGYAYILEVVKQNKMIKHNETYLNIPFNYSDDKGLCYARYPFFLWLGKDLNPHNIVEYMKNFPRLEGDGLENFQTALKTSGAKTFNILLPLYIAEKINTTKAFYSTESKYNIIGRKASSDFSSPPVIFRKKEENEAIVILNQSIEALTVSPNG